MKIAALVVLPLLAAMPAWAQLQGPPVSSLGKEPPAPPSNAVAAATPLTALSSSEKARANPAVQYLLMKTVVAKSIGIQKTRALPVEAGGYNLLKYCWTPANVLGEWGESSGLGGEMVVRALETCPGSATSRGRGIRKPRSRTQSAATRRRWLPPTSPMPRVRAPSTP